MGKKVKQAGLSSFGEQLVQETSEFHPLLLTIYGSVCPCKTHYYTCLTNFGNNLTEKKAEEDEDSTDFVLCSQ